MTVDWSPICVASTALDSLVEPIPDVASPNRGSIESPSSSQEEGLSSSSYGDPASPSSANADPAVHPQEDLSAHHFKGVEW